MTGSYKSMHASGGRRRLIPALLLVVVAFVFGVAADRRLLSTSQLPTAPAVSASDGIRLVDGVPVGYPPTARGAGNAGAHLETLLTAAGELPRAEAVSLVGRMLTDDARTDLVEQLLPTQPRTRGLIQQSTVVRVWAERAGTPDLVAVGTTVRVQTYVLALLGAGTDGTATATDTGLAGGWWVHDLTMQLTVAGWRVADVQSPVPAPPPDVDGTVRGQASRDSRVLARVLGPDSWVPQT